VKAARSSHPRPVHHSRGVRRKRRSVAVTTEDISAGGRGSWRGRRQRPSRRFRRAPATVRSPSAVICDDQDVQGLRLRHRPSVKPTTTGTKNADSRTHLSPLLQRWCKAVPDMGGNAGLAAVPGPGTALGGSTDVKQSPQPGHRPPTRRQGRRETESACHCPESGRECVV